MDRSEHLQWCKDRAMKYIKKGDISNAFISMVSDLGKHPETQDHGGILLGMSLFISGNLNNIEQMQEFINGFN